MEKDFSWTKSAQRYQRMYSEISDERHGDTISFDEAFELLSDAYKAVDAENRKNFIADFQLDYHRSIQIKMTGRANGVMSITFDYEGIHVYPHTLEKADAYVVANFDHLLGMAKGTVSFDKLYMTGQLKIAGNLSKGMELRPMLTAPFKG